MSVDNAQDELEVQEDQEVKESILSRKPYEGQERAEALVPENAPTEDEDEELSKSEETDELDPEEKTFKKRYGDLRRHSTKKQRDLQKRIEALESSLEENKANPQMPVDEEAIAAWKEEYPEAYDVFVQVARQEADGKMSEVQALRQELDEAHLETAQEKAVNVIRERHPDWDDIRESDDFHIWASEQPQSIQDTVYDNETDGEAAARVLDLFKLDNDMSTNVSSNPKKEMKKAAAELVTRSNSKSAVVDGKPKKVWKTSEISKMSLSEYERHEDDILLAREEGRLVEG